MHALGSPKFVSKGWGYELWIANNDKYCGKILCVLKDRKCSMHFHLNKHETFYIVSGTIQMKLIEKNGDKVVLNMTKGDTLEVPPGLMHQFKSTCDLAEIMEVSTFHDDEDSYRVVRGD